MLILQFVILLVLMTILAQDIAYRAVSWWLFPVLTALFVTWNMLHHFKFMDVVKMAAITLLLLSIQYFLLMIYFSIKAKRPVHILNNLIGAGDLLFLVSVAFYLEFVSFFFFYILSLLIILMIWGGWLITSKVKNKHLPLAGLQAGLLFLLIAADWWITPLLTDERWLFILIKQ